jgi:hypothetical protein
MNELSDIQKEIIHTFNVEHEENKISVIDSIKFFDDFLNENRLLTIMKKYNDNELLSKQLSEIDKYIINKMLNPLYKKYMYLSQTFFENLSLQLYFILNNPLLFDSYQFKNIHKNLILVRKIPGFIKASLTYVWNDDSLRNFFNEFLFDRWLKSLNYEKMTYDKFINIAKEKPNSREIYQIYSDIWSVFEENNSELKLIINDFYLKYKGFTNVPGCYKLSKELYAYFAEMNIGLPLGNQISFYQVLQWGIEEFDKIKKLMKDTIDELEPKLEDLSLYESIKAINNMDKYKFRSREHYIEDHKINIKKYRDYFVNEKKLPLLKEPQFIDFNEEKMGGGYWYLDTFYLNTSDWDSVTTFETIPLVLHETIPGHHLQLSYQLHSGLNNSLSTWFNIHNNGYAEGWALFSEKLVYDFDNFKYLGILINEMLRTLRIIADISIHYYGIEPSEIIDFFKKYLPLHEKSIESEIYRYVCLPGQALCYKIGNEMIKRLFMKKFNRKNKLLDDDAIQLYKELIVNKTMPLELFCRKYEINFNFN